MRGDRFIEAGPYGGDIHRYGRGKGGGLGWNVRSPEVRLPGFGTRANPLNCFFFRILAKGRLVSEDGVKRRLAAIVAVDVVGFSRLMGEDEAGTLARLKTLRPRAPRNRKHTI